MKFMDVILVGVGGFVGSIIRYGVVLFCQAGTGASTFPVGTLVVNCVGCFLMGCLQGAAVRMGLSSGGLLFLGVGVLGGFTTFSAFGWDWLKLLQAHKPGWASLYVCLTLTLGFMLVWFGRMLTAPR